MKTLIIYDSRLETQNTKKIAVAMANAIQADIVPIEEVFEFHLEKYDLVGFGSGIFFNKFSKTLRQYIENLQPLAQTCFVFYTSGMKECNRATSQLTNLLELKQRKCLGV